MAKPIIVNNPVLPTNGMVGGETVSEWTEDWFKWAWNTPGPSPLTDTTGALADVNQPTGMFFIAGNTGGDTVREFSAPHDTPMLVPVLNELLTQFSGKGPDPVTGGKAAANIAVKDFQHSITDMFLKVDGNAVKNLQSDWVRTDWMNMGSVQAGSLLDQFGVTGALDPSKGSGYWAVVKGFAAGTTHTIEFGGSSTLFGGFSVHITDTIHIV